MPFFPASNGEFSPLWRMLDDYATHRTTSCDSKPHSKAKSACNPSVNAYYQPRFDVKEYTDHFELNGELPGVAQANIDIEFTDPQTLQIKGHSTRHEDSPSGEKNRPPLEAPRHETTQPPKATVEDEQMANPDAEASEGDWTPVPTPTSTPVPEAAKDIAAQQQPASKVAKPRYWLSERAVGRFQRVFTFPGDRVDPENVKASLRDGILRVIVPKAPERAKVKINIQ